MFEQIFTIVLNEGIDSGYVKPNVIFVDATHIKANANKKKQMKVHVPKAVKIYEEQLHKEIDEDRDDHDKKPLKDKEEKEELVEKTVSTTDPESGLFCKGEHEMKISIDELQDYLSDRYCGWATEQGMFMKLGEEIGEVAEVLNKRAGRKASDENDLQEQLGIELVDMIHYIVAIAAIAGLFAFLWPSVKNTITSKWNGTANTMNNIISSINTTFEYLSIILAIVTQFSPTLLPSISNTVFQIREPIVV